MNCSLEKQAVEDVRKVPNKYRAFVIDLRRAAEIYGVKDGLLQRLLDLGFPHSKSRGEFLFDVLDLQNVTLRLRIRSPFWDALNLWSRPLRNPMLLEGSACELRMVWTCPELGHEGGCHFTPVGEALRSIGEGGWSSMHEGSKRIEVHLEDGDHYFDDRFTPVLDEAQRMIFHKLPWQLSHDLGFLSEAGLADCGLATRRLLRIAMETDLIARPACGFFVGAPFPAPHMWLEIHSNGEWRAADPFFLNTLHNWGIMDPNSWPIRRSPRHVLWRVASAIESSMPLIEHNGQLAKVELLARHIVRSSVSDQGGK